MAIPVPQFMEGGHREGDEWPASPVSRLVSIVAAWCEAARRRPLFGRRLHCCALFHCMRIHTGLSSPSLPPSSSSLPLPPPLPHLPGQCAL